MGKAFKIMSEAQNAVFCFSSNRVNVERRAQAQRDDEETRVFKLKSEKSEKDCVRKRKRAADMNMVNMLFSLSVHHSK